MKSIFLTQLQSQLYKWLMRMTTASAVRRIGEMPISIGSDIGNARNENQDRVAVVKVQLESNQTFMVVALCDGMGGMSDGSACASQALASFFISCISNRNAPPSVRLSIAAMDANRVVHALYKGSGGATLSAILVDYDGKITGVNIGDSRIYSHSDSQLKQLSVDDTMKGLRPNFNNDIRAGNELLQFVGIGDSLEPHIVEVDVLPNLIIMTSDGVHYFDKNVMQMVIQNAKEPAIAVKRLIDVAKWCGGRDNASIAIMAPSLVQTPLSDDTKFIQVWDSFGELQMMVPDETVNQKMCNREPWVKVPAVQKVADELKRLTKAENKKKTPRKRMKEKVVPTLEETDPALERPQLNIYFNGVPKKDGQHD